MPTNPSLLAACVELPPPPPLLLCWLSYVNPLNPSHSLIKNSPPARIAVFNGQERAEMLHRVLIIHPDYPPCTRLPPVSTALMRKRDLSTPSSASQP
jgi:hypothetical protein